MSLWSRIGNVFREDRVSREIDEELRSHVDEAIEQGRDPVKARRAFGAALQRREESHDLRVIPWLDSLRADAVFGWRQLNKRKVASAAAILSLALAIGACTSAFRLIDAMLFRPLPVAEPERLYSISYEQNNNDGKPETFDSTSYPQFRRMRATVGEDAELIAVSYAVSVDLTYASDHEMERAYRQYASGWMFHAFGIQPAVGRLLRANDDLEPETHPYAVLSYDYWVRRFGRDPKAIGRTFRMGDDVFEIVGVAAEGFTGTETGTMTDIFVPIMMMNARTIGSPNSFWFRTLVRIRPGVSVPALRDKLYSMYLAYEQERAKTYTSFSKSRPQITMRLESAAAGVSNLQRNYRRSLVILGVLVSLVLLIACANVANLMTAQAASRAREMALRVSIGAGRWRLVQLVLVESALLALLAGAVGGLFAWQSAPLVVSMINPPDNPARLVLPADWRVLGFGLLLTAAVTFLLGVAPALRASRVSPASALKGGENPHSRRRLMHALVACQAAFCFVVLFVAGLFVTTFHRLSDVSTGFSPEHLLVLDTAAERSQAPALWAQVAEHLRSIPGIENVALAGWPLMSGTMSNNFVSIHGARPDGVLAFFLKVSPGWLQTMKIPLIDGRDFRDGDVNPSVALVNKKFVQQYFGGANPIGDSFETVDGKGVRTRFRIVGVVGDACYRDIREPMLPVAYLPFDSKPRRWGTLMVRTAGANPLALASILRQEVSRARSEFRVSNVHTQLELIHAQTVRERLLSMLAMFFAVVALVLAGVGLYGVLDYSVLQRRREIGIRMAVGAPAIDIARRVTREVFAMVLVGAAAGLALGMMSARYVESLLFEVKATDLSVLAIPSLTIFAAMLFAAVPAVIRAVRIDPVAMLRSE